MTQKAAMLLFASLTAITVASAELPPVIINEVMYHPGNEQDALQYVELFNRSGQEIDLSGWSFTHGPKFIFPEKTAMPAHGFLVVARDLSAFRNTYRATGLVLGNFSGRLSHHGGKIELVDRANKVVESFKYSDHAPWPSGPDGYLRSLERICPEGPSADPHNWAGSKLGQGKVPGGSPGAANENYSARPLPVIEDVKWVSCVVPGEPIVVSATIASASALENAELRYELLQPRKAGASANLPMRRVLGDVHAGRYEASIPSPADGTLVRFSIKALDHDSLARIEPSPDEPRPAYSAYVAAIPARARIPMVTLLNPVPLPRRGNQKFHPAIPESHQDGSSAFIYIPPQGNIELFDFVEVRRRTGGLKVHFRKDHLLDGMSGINLIFEGPSRWVLSEHLAYELYEKCGLRCEKSGHFRLTVDGRPLGYYLFVEQPNKTFLARTGRNEDGNVYKLLWYNHGVVQQHEKKTNLSTGHGDIIAVIDTLNKKSGDAQWAYIKEQFNVDEVVNYFAVNMCIQNWDGFFNNYFAYHDLTPGGKWEMIPWDEDKTWGDYDGVSRRYDWYEMPLTMGMNDDPAGKGWAVFRQGPFGGTSWWRPPGWFSGPLLANPQFRKKFEARLREICMTVFTEEQFGPSIDTLKNRLRTEVALRAQLKGADEQEAVKEFDDHIDSFRRQLVNRRKFILSHLEN